MQASHLVRRIRRTTTIPTATGTQLFPFFIAIETMRGAVHACPFTLGALRDTCEPVTGTRISSHTASPSYIERFPQKVSMFYLPFLWKQCPLRHPVVNSTTELETSTECIHTLLPKNIRCCATLLHLRYRSHELTTTSRSFPERKTAWTNAAFGYLHLR